MMKAAATGRIVRAKQAPRLEIADWRMIAAIAEAGSVTRAAQQLCVSQSALSHRLIKLEQSLQLRLFDRVGKRMRPAAAGEALADFARRVLPQCLEAERAIDLATVGRRRRSLRIATGCPSYYIWLASVLAKFGSAHSGLDIRVEIHSPRDETEALSEDLADFVITARPPTRADLEVVRLFATEVVALAPPRHPLSRRSAAGKRVSWNDLEAQTLLIHDLPSTDEAALRNAVWRDHRTAPKGAIQRVQLTEAIVAMVKSGLGIAVVNHPAGPSVYEDADLRVVRLRPRHDRAHFAVWRVANPRDLPLQPLASAIAEAAYHAPSSS
jgi:LysR family transcriptional regulator for metE and metH